MTMRRFCCALYPAVLTSSAHIRWQNCSLNVHPLGSIDLSRGLTHCRKSAIRGRLHHSKCSKMYHTHGGRSISRCLGDRRWPNTNPSISPLGSLRISGPAWVGCNSRKHLNANYGALGNGLLPRGRYRVMRQGIRVLVSPYYAAEDWAAGDKGSYRNT
jgi:hypothetical protein